MQELQTGVTGSEEGRKNKIKITSIELILLFFFHSSNPSLPLFLRCCGDGTEPPARIFFLGSIIAAWHRCKSLTGGTGEFIFVYSPFPPPNLSCGSSRLSPPRSTLGCTARVGFFSSRGVEKNPELSPNLRSQPRCDGSGNVAVEVTRFVPAKRQFSAVPALRSCAIATVSRCLCLSNPPRVAPAEFSCQEPSCPQAGCPLSPSRDVVRDTWKGGWDVPRCRLSCGAVGTRDRDGG